MRKRCFLIALLLFGAAAPGFARVTPAEYREVGVTVPFGARLPLSAFVTDEGGRRRLLRELVTRPTVLVFADYTCRTLCGPIVAFAADALRKSGLKPGEQYEFLAVGLDPKDKASDAAKMRQDHFGRGKAALFVSADAATVKTLTAALGYRYRYDAEADQFVHPAAAYVLRSDGGVTRVLTGIGLSGDDMRLALVEASEGKIGTLRDRVRLLCSGFDPTHGTYNVMVSRLLAVTGAATMLALGGGIGLLWLMGRRRPT